MLQWLIAHGAKVEKDDLGGTPLHDAAEHGQLEVRKAGKEGGRERGREKVWVGGGKEKGK